MESIKGSLRLYTCACNNDSEPTYQLERLSPQDFEILTKIQEYRRCLPVNRSGVWYCQECHFYTESIEVMARHLLQFHDAASPDRKALCHETH